MLDSYLRIPHTHIKVNWESDASGVVHILNVPCFTHETGNYEIVIHKRPNYCDRGDWLIHMGGHHNDIDHADGFPRYFFGTAAQAKAQMETWLYRRRAYHEAERRAIANA